MIQIIIGILLTGAILYLAQFIALGTATTRILLYLFSSTAVWALLQGAGNKDKWVLLRRRDGQPLGNGTLAGVSAAVVALAMFLLLMAYHWWIPTLLVVCIATICCEAVFKAISDTYKSACERRKKAQKEKAKGQGNDSPRPMPQQMAGKDRGVPRDIQAAAEQELEDLYSQ